MTERSMNVYENESFKNFAILSFLKLLVTSNPYCPRMCKI